MFICKKSKNVFRKPIILKQAKKSVVHESVKTTEVITTIVDESEKIVEKVDEKILVEEDRTKSRRKNKNNTV